MMNKEITHIKQKSKDQVLSSLNYVEFLEHYLRPVGYYGSQKKSLSEVALELGYNTPSILSMILKGKRVPSRKFIDRFCEVYKLNSTESELLWLLIEAHKLKIKGKDPQVILERIECLCPSQETNLLDLKWFKKISGWHYMAIKNLINTPDFIEDDHLIAKQLKDRVTPRQVREAIELLLELGVLARVENGRLAVSSEPWRTPKGINSSAIRNFHKGMIEQALYSLTHEKQDRRHISGLTLQFDNTRKEEAVSDIMLFLSNFNQKYHKDDSKHIGQLNIQFFKLNKDLKGMIQ